MSFLGALGAAGSGYIDQLPKTYEMMGMEALGKAFQMPQGPIDQMGGQGPQMPGQPQHPLGSMAQGPMPPMMGGSSPMEGGLPMGGPPNMVGAPPSGPPQFPFMTGQPGPFPQPPASAAPLMQAGGPLGGQSAPNTLAPPGGMPQGGMFDLHTLASRIQAANPGLPPQAMAAALMKAMPLLNADGKLQLAQMGLRMKADAEDRRWIQGDRRLEQGERKTDIAEGEAGRKTDQGNRRLDITEGESARKKDQGAARIEQGEQRISQGDRRLDQRDATENRLMNRQIFSQDQAYKNFELKKQEQERKIASGDRSADLSQLRATIAAQHNRAMEIINANMTNMPAAQKKKIETEANAVRDEALKRIEGMAKPKTEGPAQKGGMVGKPGEEIIGGGGTTPARPRAKGQAGQPDLEWDGTAWVPVK